MSSRLCFTIFCLVVLAPTILGNRDVDVERNRVVALSGRRCANDSFCGFHGENYQWCWLDREHTEWDHCCFVGSQCRRGYSRDGHYSHFCRTCKNQAPTLSTATDKILGCSAMLSPPCRHPSCRATICEARDYPCNPTPVTRSVNNYECASPCSSSQEGMEFAWCWVKPDKNIWDWCCFLGETCGTVLPEDRRGNKTMCYGKPGRKWPMECKVEAEPTPLPHYFVSPPRIADCATSKRVIFHASIVMLLSCGILFCYLRSRRGMEKRQARVCAENAAAHNRAFSDKPAYADDLTFATDPTYVDKPASSSDQTFATHPTYFDEPTFAVIETAEPVNPPPYPGSWGRLCVVSEPLVDFVSYPADPPPNYEGPLRSSHVTLL